MSLLGVELGFRVHWKILGICQWLLINQSFSQVGKHLGFSRLDYLFSTNMNQELKMRVYIVGSFVFSTIYNLVFPLPVMASPVESLGCSISKVLKDGDDITLTHLWHRERLAGGRNVPSGTVVEANVPTSSFTTKKLFGWGDACGKWLLELQPSSLLLANRKKRVKRGLLSFKEIPEASASHLYLSNWSELSTITSYKLGNVVMCSAKTEICLHN